jgi:hypothetical protein
MRTSGCRQADRHVAKTVCQFEDRLVGRHQLEVNPQATNDMVEVVDVIGAVLSGGGTESAVHRWSGSDLATLLETGILVRLR